MPFDPYAGRTYAGPPSVLFCAECRHVLTDSVAELTPEPDRDPARFIVVKMPLQGSHGIGSRGVQCGVCQTLVGDLEELEHLPGRMHIVLNRPAVTRYVLGERVTQHEAALARATGGPMWVDEGRGAGSSAARAQQAGPGPSAPGHDRHNLPHRVEQLEFELAKIMNILLLHNEKLGKLGGRTSASPDLPRY